MQLDLSEKERNEWDKAIEKADQKFEKMEHNLITNNCHSHVAYVLSEIKYKGKSNYDMTDVFKMVNMRSKYVSFGHVVKTYIGFMIFIAVIVFLYRKI